MFTQLSLFDLPSVDQPCHFETAASPVVAVGKTKSLEPVKIYGEVGPRDSIQPMGDLARLVLARYEMAARRRQERLRRQAEQPRKSIRVLSPS